MMDKYALKRCFDILFGIALILISLPLFLLISLLIKAMSKGPVFFLDERVGKGQTLFKLYKFRSMIVHDKRDDDEKMWFTQKNDSRITPIGSVLRKTSLDELPQLINVIKGEMSLVGPRPESPKSKGIYDDYYWMKVHSVLPGMTGLAQIKGRSDLGLERKIQYDLEYINTFENNSGVKNLICDMRILFYTVRVVLLGSGAN